MHFCEKIHELTWLKSSEISVVLPPVLQKGVPKAVSMVTGRVSSESVAWPVLFSLLLTRLQSSSLWSGLQGNC